MNRQEEISLVTAAQHGDINAFAALVREHQAQVRGFLTRVLRDSAQADDLAQDVFVQGFRDLNAFTARGPLVAWFLGIARHRVQVHWRSESRRRARALQWSWLGEQTDDPDPGQHEREMAALDACLEVIPTSQASLLREHYFAATSLVEIARRRGKKVVAIRVALFRARLWLRACMTRRLANSGIHPGAQPG